MRIRILGSAAGGGFPQWNCHCEMCEVVRAGGRARPRTQSSLAVRGDRGPWFLVNASPDVAHQLQSLEPEPDGVRVTPVEGVLLTDAEIDHTSGLLFLRESSTPVELFASVAVQDALREAFDVLTVLERFCGLHTHPLTAGEVLSLPGSSLDVEPFYSGGDAPLYLNRDDPRLEAMGLTFSERSGKDQRLRTVTYIPGLARLDDAIRLRLRSSDAVLVDGTFWEEDDLMRLGISGRGARAMGHLPLSGEGGMLELLTTLAVPRKILVHINNTNPILLDDGPQRAAVEAAGAEVGYDGLEFTL